MRGLSEQQVTWLRSAAREAVNATAQAQMRNDAEELGNLCRRGKVQFVSAAQAQVSELRAAFAPAYVWLRQDKQSSEFLDAIEALRVTGIRPYSQESLACTVVDTTGAPGIPAQFDGTYRMVTTEQDIRRSDPSVTPENWGTWIFVFDRGHFAFTQENLTACTWGYGTYAVTGAHVAWRLAGGGGVAPTGAVNKPGEHFVFTWSIYRDTLTLTAVTGEISPDNFLLQPWHRLDTKPSASSLNKRCPPPAQALPG
jgi:hypothetical protein